jgi:ketosteroid isomerase-like protein
MTEHPDVTLVKQGYDAFNRADLDTLTSLIAEDAVQHMVGNNLMSGDFKGRDATLGLYARIGELTNGTYRAQVEQTFTDGKGTVVVVHRQTAERDGKRLDNRQALVFTIQTGRSWNCTTRPTTSRPTTNSSGSDETGSSARRTLSPAPARS